MKIASSSAGFDRDIAAGNLTQLEWLTTCAGSLALDGIVFDARHFPRTDDEYFAQLKKLSVDLCLTIAAMACDTFFTADDARWIEAAQQLGAPIVIARPPSGGDSLTAWNQTVAAAKTSAAAAKRANVTIALRNAPGTLCANDADLKRFTKDVDSSWIRYALDLATLPSVNASAELLPRTVIATHVVDTTNDSRLDDVAHALRAFRGFLVVDADADEEHVETILTRAVTRIRSACALQNA